MSDSLFNAVDNDDIDFVKEALESGADVNARSNGRFDNTLLFRVHSFEMAKLLIEYGADVNARDYLGDTPLHNAVSYVDTDDLAEMLVSNGADVNAKNDKGQTPLHLVASAEIAELLINNGADINSRDNDGNTPFHFAEIKEVAEVLIKHGADVNAKNNDGKTPYDLKHKKELSIQLLEVLKNNDIAQVKELVEHGADVNYWAGSWYSSLYLAKTAEIAEFLIEHGANVNSINDDGEEPLYWAVCYDYVDVAEVLIKHGANVNNIDYCGLSALSQASSLEMLKLLFENGVNISEKDPCGVDTVEAAEYLIAHGAQVTDISPINKIKNPELFEFLINRFNIIPDLFGIKLPEIAEICIKHGADVNERNDDGKTPLFYVKDEENSSVGNVDVNIVIGQKPKTNTIPVPEIAKFLVNHGADVNVKDKKGCTLLHYVETPEMAEFLIKHGADVNARDNEGKTPLYFALTEEIMKILIDNGADIHATDNNGIKPLTIVQKQLFSVMVNNDVDQAKEIIKSGIDINVYDLCKGLYRYNVYSDHNLTPLHIAVIIENIELVQLLIDHGADVNAVDSDYKTPLCYATNKEIAKVLIESGANVNTIVVDKYTQKFQDKRLNNHILSLDYFLEEDFNENRKYNLPLHYMSRSDGNISMVKFLVENGADVNAKGNKDQTALFGTRNKRIAEYLINHGADVDARDESGKTPLIYIIDINPDKETIICLISNGADVNAKDKWGKTPLHYARTADLTEVLINHGADVNAMDNDGETIIYKVIDDCYCDENNKIALIDLLIKHGADVNARNKFGQTPLFYASSRLHCVRPGKIAEVLINHGADINTKDNNGKTLNEYIKGQISELQAIPEDKMTIREEVQLESLLKIAEVLKKHGAK